VARKNSEGLRVIPQDIPPLATGGPAHQRAATYFGQEPAEALCDRQGQHAG